MKDDVCKVDTSRTDTYDRNEAIPDLDVETCLKVIRTLRNWALYPGFLFDANAAVLLSHTHKWIVEKVREVIQAEFDRALRGKESK